MRTSPTSRISSLALTLACLGGLSAASSGQEGGAPAAQDAIAKVEEAGGRVEHEAMDPEKPVVAISFATKPIGDAAIEGLGAFSGLQKLTLNNTQITDTALTHLAGLGSLEKLYLVDTQITDNGLPPLKDLKGLKILSLAGTQVGDAGLEHIRAMESLQTVFLAGSKVTDEGVKTLQEARPMLQIVR